MDTAFSNPFPYGSQPYVLLEHVKRGPVANYEFRALGMLSYTKIICIVRDALRPQGYTVEKKHVRGGVYRYELAKMTKPKPRSWIGQMMDWFA